MSDAVQRFANLVHIILTVNICAGINIKSVAHKMGIKSYTLRSRIRGDDRRTKFTLDELKSPIQSTENLRLINLFIEGTTFIGAKRMAHSAAGTNQKLEDAIRDGADKLFWKPPTFWRLFCAL